ncbi:MAG: thioredoxin domain-containing protein [Leucothrix sp.]
MRFYNKLVALALLSCLLFSYTAKANSLDGHHSPYLAMHGKDPIQWVSWGEAALERARKENKLLYVSIGYFACHWCHVMHQESFSDKAVAKRLNKGYIPVKVDRELNPVLDKRLIEFVSVTNGVAGWPLNVFITPDGFPLVGATYMPKDHFYGVLETIGKRWKDNPTGIKAQAKKLNGQLKGMLGVLELTTKDHSISSRRAEFLKKTMEQADDLQGGFGNQKFPNIPQLSALLRVNALKPDPEIDAFLRLTLDAIISKGLHDAIGDGFFRYTIDPGWKTPHFEKMLYTNAQMPILLLQAAEYFNEPHYRTIALETLDFLNRSMQGKHAFIASLSAVDQDGNEGAYYLWSTDDIKQLLSQKAQQLAFSAWDLNRTKDFPQGNLPVVSESIESLATATKQPVETTSHALKDIHNTLLRHRSTTRSIPKDDKQLAGWNGLALNAFAKALPYKASYLNTGNKLAHFLLTLWDGKQLKRSAASTQQGTLLDYAAVAKGLLAWSKASKQPRYAAVAAAITDEAWRLFYKEMTWHETSNSLLPNAVAQSHIADTPITSPETLLLQASEKLGGDIMQQRIRSVISTSNRSINVDPYGYASLIAFSLTTQVKGD